MRLKKVIKAGISKARIRARAPRSEISTTIVNKIKEMPPEQALQLALILGVGVGQFASSLRGEPDHYAKLYAQMVADVIDGVSKPLFTNAAIPINAFFGGLGSAIPDKIDVGIDVPGLPKVPKLPNVIPDSIPVVGKWF